MITPTTPTPVGPDEIRAMADGINKIQTAMKALLKSGLTENALVILLHHSTKVAQRDIRLVMAGLAKFGDEYLTPEYRKMLTKKKD